MKFPTYFRGALNFLCFHAVSASAATLVSNNLIISTTVGTITDTTAPTSQSVGNNGGTLTSLGSAATVTTPGGAPNLLFDLAAAASVVLSRPPGGGRVDAVSAFVEYTFVFNLAALETRLATFNLSYSLSETGINGTVTWALVGPSGSVPAISGSLGDSATSTETITSTAIPTQTTTLSTAGNYTLTLRAAMPIQGVESQKSMTVVLDDANLGLTAIPESSCLGFLSLALLALVRRR